MFSQSVCSDVLLAPLYQKRRNRLVSKKWLHGNKSDSTNPQRGGRLTNKPGGLGVARLFLLAQPLAAQVKTLEKVRFLYSAVGGSQSALWISYEAGMLRKHGLDIELLYVGGAVGPHKSYNQVKSPSGSSWRRGRELKNLTYIPHLYAFAGGIGFRL